MADLALIRELGDDAEHALTLPLRDAVHNLLPPLYNSVDFQNDVERAYHLFDPGANPMPTRDEWWLNIRSRLGPRDEHYKSAIHHFINSPGQIWARRPNKKSWQLSSQRGLKLADSRPRTPWARQQAQHMPTFFQIEDELETVFPPANMQWYQQSTDMYRDSLVELLTTPYETLRLEFEDMKDVYFFLKHLEFLNDNLQNGRLDIALPPPVVPQVIVAGRLQRDYRLLLQEFRWGIVINDPLSEYAWLALQELKKVGHTNKLYLRMCKYCWENRPHDKKKVEASARKVKRAWKLLSLYSNRSANNPPDGFVRHSTYRQEAYKRRTFVPGTLPNTHNAMCAACADLCRQQNLAEPPEHPILDAPGALFGFVGEMSQITRCLLATGGIDEWDLLHHQ